jgi:hypothetical protein
MFITTDRSVQTSAPQATETETGDMDNRNVPPWGLTSGRAVPREGTGTGTRTTGTGPTCTGPVIKRAAGPGISPTLVQVLGSKSIMLTRNVRVWSWAE